jgi:hypothetical protein
MPIITDRFSRLRVSARNTRVMKLYARLMTGVMFIAAFSSVAIGQTTLPEIDLPPNSSARSLTLDHQKLTANNLTLSPGSVLPGASGATALKLTGDNRGDKSYRYCRLFPSHLRSFLGNRQTMGFWKSIYRASSATGWRLGRQR